ncbi:MAG: transporter substrate-binding domain-containing protein, partial [Methanomicrobiales archaeon]|nr:transporter substrate-binding domain-containing protein [Methanomicrobiales archaeon]
MPAFAEQEAGLFFIVHENLPPYEFVDHEGQPSGFSCELMQVLARKTGLNITILTDQEARAAGVPGEGGSFILPVFTKGFPTDRPYLAEPLMPVQYWLYSRDEWERSRNLQAGDVIIVPRTGSPGPEILVPEGYRSAG